jgi:hypothetical protein
MLKRPRKQKTDRKSASQKIPFRIYSGRLKFFVNENISLFVDGLRNSENISRNDFAR